MSNLSMHPPAIRRCQIYLGDPDQGPLPLRCANTGTHWVKWPASLVDAPEPLDEDLYTWECPGPHIPDTKEAA